MTLSNELRLALRAQKNPAYAHNAARYFKTKPGQYGEGDVFIGVRMPTIRMTVKAYLAMPLEQVSELLASPVHEDRMAGLIIVAQRAQKASGLELRSYYDWYLDQLHLGHINNWDLVDVTCTHIVGRYLVRNNRAPLYTLIASPSLWERRVALISTFSFIENEESADALALAEKVLGDTHDLIHKAAGWVLREVGKKCGTNILTEWLDKNATKMPRTMLRYVIEQLPEPTRQHYLRLK